jgi:predicted Ser/Thr protein kinase
MLAGFPTGTQGASSGAAHPRRGGFTPPQPGELAARFPQLEILELLGRGGMGAVYKARQKQLDRLVALKILPPGVETDPSFEERFTCEARALARLSHPNIVAVHDYGRAGEFHYFIMEFVDGVNLRQMEHAGRLAPREALQIIPQICEALQFAHDEGIVHRDIKPENILLDKRGRVKIADFGLAKLLEPNETDRTITQAGHVMGTPHYMAPEQVEKPATVDHRADIYSLGVVFYEMLTGELPLGRFAVPSSRMGGVQIDVRLDEVVLRTLEKEPERRYQQASALKTEVETIATATGGGSAASFAGASIRGLRLGGWKNMPAVAAVLILLCAVLVGVLAVWHLNVRSGRPARLELVNLDSLSSKVTAAPFGPVMIRQISEIESRTGAQCLVLQTGKQLNLPEFKNNSEALQWLTAAGGNLVMDFVQGQPGLGARGVNLALMDNTRWEKGTVEELNAAIDAAIPGVPVKDRGGLRWYILSADAAFPMTFALRTDSGQSGILQIISANEAAATIRYKLARADGSGTAEEQPVESTGAEAAIAEIELRKASEQAAPPTQPANVGATIGPVIERQIKEGPEVLALESAEVINLPTNLPNNEILQWVIDHHGNLGVDFVRKQPGLGARGVLLARVDNAQWERGTVEELNAAIDAGDVGVPVRDEDGFRWHILPENTSLPMTFALRMDSGRVGILQITGVSDPVLTIRYRLAPATSAADEPEAAARATLSASAVASYSPAFETVVSGEGDANNRYIDFDTGRRFSAAELIDVKSEPSPEQTRELLKTNGIDAMGDTGPTVRGLIGFDMAAVPIPSEEWDHLPASNLDKHLALAAPGTPVTMSGKGDLPATFAIKTRKGATGLLQIMIFTANPPGVRIRYKLAQSADAAQETPATQLPPREVVSRWLQHVRDDNDTAMWDLTTRDLGGPEIEFREIVATHSIQPSRQLGDNTTAMVVTDRYKDNAGRDRVHLFFLTKKEKDERWLIRRQESTAPEDANRQVEGFASHPSVRFDVERKDIIGAWNDVWFAPATYSFSEDGSFSMRFRDVGNKHTTLTGTWRLDDGDRLTYTTERGETTGRIARFEGDVFSIAGPDRVIKHTFHRKSDASQEEPTPGVSHGKEFNDATSGSAT